jgi:hypothetical protein
MYPRYVQADFRVLIDVNDELRSACGLHADQVICGTGSYSIFLMLPSLIGYQILERDMVYVL